MSIWMMKGDKAMERLTEHSKRDFNNIIYAGKDEIEIV